MKPSTKQFTYKTIQAFDTILRLACERLSEAVSNVDADDLAGAVEELQAAAKLAIQSSEGSESLAATIDAELAATVTGKRAKP